MAGELSKAKRNKAIERATQVLPPGTQVRGFVVGRAQVRWSQAAITILVVGVAIPIVGLLFGWILYPGFLFLLGFSNALRPPRGLAIADQGVATLTRSGISGEFKDVVAFESISALNGVLTDSTRKVQVGPDLITLSSREVKQLQAMVPAAQFASPAQFAQPGAYATPAPPT
jgi:hypothetical protein